MNMNARSMHVCRRRMISIPPVCASGWPETRRENVEKDSTGRAASFADIEPHALATIVTYSVHGRRIERSTRSLTFARYDGAALTRAMRGRRARCLAVCRRHHIMMMSSLQLRTTSSSSSISLQRSAASRSARHATDYTQGEVTSQSLWSPYDHTTSCVELKGEYLSCYSNKIESVGLRKCPYDH